MAAGFNFPSRLPRGNGVAGSTLSYPLNLTAGSRNFYTLITFSKYSIQLDEDYQSIFDSITNFLGSFSDPDATPVESAYVANYVPDNRSRIILPIPRKLNENQVLSWSEKSLTDIVSGFGARNRANGIANRVLRGRVGQLVSGAANLTRLTSAVTGITVNPFVFIYFDRPQFKRYSLTWTLAARNQEESESIRNIVLKLKERSSPTIARFFMRYPDIINIGFYPDNVFGMLPMKKCVIESVGVDYTPSGPSFFDSNAPTLVNLTINLKEIELWEQNDYISGGDTRPDPNRIGAR